MAKAEVAALLKELQGKHKGLNALTTLGQLNSNYPVFSTGILSLDSLFGRGIVGTKVYELYGKESSGKSLILFHIMAQVQKAGYIVVLYDAERYSDDPTTHEWMARFGVDPENVIYVRDTAEASLDVLIDACKNPKVGLIAIDSIAWMVSDEEFSRDMEKKEMAEIAKLLPKFLRKYTACTKNASLVVINQARDSVGTFATGYAAKISTPGGRALKHRADVRAEVAGARIIIDKEDVGLQVKVKTEKNRLFIPKRKSFFNLFWDSGVDHVEQVVRLSTGYNFFDRSGAWYKGTINGEQIMAQGMEKLTELIRSRPDYQEALTKMILETKDRTVATEEDDDE